MNIKRTNRIISLALIVLLIIVLMLSGCAKSQDQGSSATTTTKASTTTKAVTTAAERITLRMFMGDSGVPHPPGVDPSDNAFIKIIEDHANVDLQMEVPGYQDFGTKFNIMLASGDLPDVVHSWLLDDALRAAESGAFIDLKGYYDSSDTMKRVITEQMMELSKTESGKYYRIPMAWDKAPQGSGNWVRYDLLVEYNGGQYPTSVDGYVEFLRWVKNNKPNSIPLSCRVQDGNIFAWGETFFNWYGAPPHRYRVQDGEFISTFILPEYREAVELFKQLFDEGILDREFALNDQDKRLAKCYNNYVALGTDTSDQLINSIQASYSSQPGNEDAVYVFTPNLVTYPSVLKDVKYTYGNQPMIISPHGLYISAGSKHQDSAWMVIEGFSTDELFEAIFWGSEGSEYTVVDGKRIPDPEKLNAEDRFWGLHLAVIFGFQGAPEVKEAIAELTLGEELFAMLKDSQNILAQNALKAGIPMLSPGFFIAGLMPEIDSVKTKLAESNNFIAEATSQAIMGTITMSEFDKRVESFKTQYGFIAQAYTKYMNDNRDELRKKGCIEVDW